MFQLNEPISLGQQVNLEALYGAAISGIILGLLSAVVSHLSAGPIVGVAVMMLLYGAFLSSMRGWKEFCALMAMLGTFVAYFAAWEAFRLGSSLFVSIVLSVLVVAFFVVYIPWLVDTTTKIRALLLGRSATISTREAMNLPLQDKEQWLLGPPLIVYRTIAAIGKLSTLQWVICLMCYRLLMSVAGLLSAVWFDNALLASLGASMFLYQTVALTRLTRWVMRASQPSVERMLEKDSRPPVLFLRPFSLDEFVVHPFTLGWRGFEAMFSSEQKTFEEYLNGAFNDVGPVVAIGRPGEAAAPIGAAREYLDDASWQKRVLERADAARLVIMVCDATPGMKWEIENVPQRVGFKRIMLVLPLGEDVDEKRSPEWYQRWATLREKFTFLPEVSEDTIAVLFDENGFPILVSSNAPSLPKRIAVIKNAWLKNSQ